MKCRNTFWISLVCGISLACAPMVAQAAQQDVPPPANGQMPPLPSGSPLPPLPQHLDADQRDAQRTIFGPYRLTYTLTELDGSRQVASHRYAIVLDAGRDHGPTSLQLGTKVPVETGEVQGGSASQTISYIHVGMGIQASLLRAANGLELSTRIDQSAVDSEQTLAKSPIIRAASFDSNVLLNEEKPLTLGTVDMPGTTRVLQIQVVLTKVR